MLLPTDKTSSYGVGLVLDTITIELVLEGTFCIIHEF